MTYRLATSLLMLLGPLVLYAQESIYEREGWPGEGIPVLIASSNELHVRAAADLRSRASTIPYRQGWLIPFSATVVRTIEARELTTLMAETLNVWCVGEGAQEVDLSDGQVWTYLQYRAEGHVMARIDGEVCELPVLLREDVFGVNLPEPSVQWWVQVLYEDGSSPGWLLVDEEQVDFGRRRF